MGLQFMRKLLSESYQDALQSCLNSCSKSSGDPCACAVTCVSALPESPYFRELKDCILKSCKLPISEVCRSCFNMEPVESSSSHKVGKVAFLMIMLSILSFVLACCYTIYVKFIKPRRIRSQQQDHHQEEERFETHDQLLLVDQEQGQGPAVDHHIWHIRTVGLQPSVISSITVCKYKKGDGLIEGTECSVCLSEFEEDEDLKLLPKCSHAFHIPCIDTWLTSHTSCPMCRAPIVKNIARAATSEANIENTRPREETQIAVLEDEQESDREMEGGDSELRRATEEEESELRSSNSNEEEDGIQPLRRSVSLDSLSAFKIVQAIANIESSDRNSVTQPPVKESGSSAEIVPKRAGGNQNLVKFMATSSFGRSLQIGPSSLKRSFSCSGKLFLSRPRRSRNLVLPS